MKVTIVLPVSREDYLKRILAQLELMHCDAENTNLMVYVDGTIDLYAKARDMVVNAKFKEKLTVYRRAKHNPDPSNWRKRRKRIAEIHNELKGMIGACDYLFLIEDDTLIPLNALERLLKAYTLHPYAGFISGVQLGRWGFTVPGIWKVDNVYTTKEVTSQMPPKTDIPGQTLPTEEIDASGFYCMLTKREHYMSVDHQTFEDALGPDVYYGLQLRQQGYKNYVDWQIQTAHLTKRGEINLRNTKIQQIKLVRTENGWQTIVL